MDPPGAEELLASPLRDAPIAVLDLEMTGLSPSGDRVCEVAVVRGTDGRVEREFQTLVRPEVRMSAGALKCTGITDAMLIGAPVFGEIAGDVVATLRSSVLVAHNVDFDLGFLHREFDGTPVVLPPPVTLDTLLVARRLFAFRRNGLGDVCRALGVEVGGGHRALSDARAAFALFFRMAAIVDPHRAFTVRDLADLVGALAPSSPLRLAQQQVLRDAHRERRTVEIAYLTTSDGGTQVSRAFDVWFLRLPKLQGYCHLRRAERILRLDRITSVHLLDRTFEVPDGAECRL